MPGKSKFTVSWQNVIFLLLTATTYAVLPLLLLIFCLVWLIRAVLTLWIKTSPKLLDYGPFLTGVDTILATACPYSKSPLTSSVSNYMVIDGRLELEEFRRRVESRWPQIVGKGKNRRRLTQYLTTWAGFLVFRDELNFKVSDHIRLLNINELNERVDRQCDRKSTTGTGAGAGADAGLRKIPRMKKKLHKDHWTAEELAQLVNDLTTMPYEQNKSPWEFLLLHNPDPNGELKCQWTTFLILRIHHCMADGVALFSLVAQILDQSQNEALGKTLESFSTVQNPSSSLSLFVNSVGTVLSGIPEFMSHQFHIWPPGRRPFVQDRTDEAWAFLFQVPFDQIKVIRQNNKGVSTMSIFMTAFALAVHQYKRQVQKGNHFASKSESESDVAAEMPSNLFVLALSAGPRERNEFTNLFLSNPMRITAEATTDAPETDQEPVQDSRQLLRKTNREYLRILASRIPEVVYCLERWLGIMPQFMLLRKLTTNYCNGVFSNIPYFETQVSILGHPILSSCCASVAPATPDFAVISLGYHDKLYFHVELDKKTFKSQDQGRILAKLFEQQIREISNGTPESQPEQNYNMDKIQ